MKKKKLWSSIARIAVALLFVGSWTVLGITLALTQVGVTLNGGITFTAEDIYATITGSMTGNTSTANVDKLQTINIDAYSTNTGDGEKDIKDAIESWDGLDLVFGRDPITITITIQNRSEENAINITFTDGLAKKTESGTTTAISGLSVARRVGTLATGAYSYVNVDGELDFLQIGIGETKQIEITLNITNRNSSLDVDQWAGLGMKLDSTRVFTTEYYTERGLTFSNFTDGEGSSAGSCTLSAVGSSVTTLDIPNSVMNDGKVYNVTQVGLGGTSVLSTQVTSVTIPDSVTTIGANAFNGATQLTNVTISNTSNLTSIGGGAFKNTAISSIYIPESVVTISSNAFNGCSSLTSVTGLKKGTWQVTKDSDVKTVTIDDATTAETIASYLTDNTTYYRAYTWNYQAS